MSADSTAILPSLIRKPARLTRRGFLKTCLWGGSAGTALGSGTLAYARYVAPFTPMVEERPLPLRRLPRELVGLTILHLTDLHLADDESHQYLSRELENCRQLKPDMILLTGDYVTRGELRWVQRLGKLVTQLHARLGVLAVLGNHDYSVFRNNGAITHPQRRNADMIAESLRDAGVDVLRNESRVLSLAGEKLQIAGIDDVWSGRFDPHAAFSAVDPSLPCIALGHNPDMVDQIRDYPWDWLLCGHTHGGQVRLPLFGAPLLPLLNKRYDMGLFPLGEKCMFVNRGLGYLRPIRFNCPPEIALFTLATKNSGS